MSTGFGWIDAGSDGQSGRVSSGDYTSIIQYELEPEVARVSWLPVIVGSVALLVSVGLLPLGAGLPSVVGYVLTPFVVVFSLAKARSTYVRRLDDQWFDRGRARQRLLILQVLTAVAFVVALPHIWDLSKAAALWLQ